ncbi:MAG: minor extracellular protease Epr [Parasphingorhabdus sp.]|jgi:minor extracellular protease Epr
MSHRFPNFKILLAILRSGLLIALYFVVTTDVQAADTSLQIKTPNVAIVAPKRVATPRMNLTQSDLKLVAKKPPPPPKDKPDSRNPDGSTPDSSRPPKPRPTDPKDREPTNTEPNPQTPGSDSTDSTDVTSDRPKTQPKAPDKQDQRAQSTGASVENRKPARPVSTGSLISIALPTFSAQSATNSTSTEAAVDERAEHEPRQVVFASVDIDQAKRVIRAAAPLGFRLKSRIRLGSIDTILSTLRVPLGMKVHDAIANLRQAFPDILFDANHRYQVQKSPRDYSRESVGIKPDSVCDKPVRIGLIDTGLDLSSSVLQQATINQYNVLPAGIEVADTTHGSRVATILVGSAPKYDYSGLLAAAELVAVNVFRGIGDKRIDTTVTWILQGINTVLKHNVDVINMSLGGPGNQILEHSMKKVMQLGIPVIAAAGNSGPKSPPMYPAAYDSVVAVTAVDAKDQVFSKANQGSYIDFSAPGVDVFIPAGKRGSGYRSGTSFATAFVSAAYALWVASNRDKESMQGYARLQQISVDLGVNGRDSIFGWGKINFDQLCN